MTTSPPPPPPTNRWNSVPISLTTSRRTQIIGMVIGALGVGASTALAASGHRLTLIPTIVCTILFALLGGVIGWASAIDASEHRLPNRLTYPLIPATLIIGFIAAIAAGQPHRISSLIISGLTGGFVFFVAALTVSTGMGMGDAKLAVSTTALAGWWSYPSAMWHIFAAFFFAGIAVLVLVALRRATMKTRIAFGPFLLIGLCAALTWNAFASPFSW